MRIRYLTYSQCKKKKTKLVRQRLVATVYEQLKASPSCYMQQSHHQLAPAPTSPIPTPTPRFVVLLTLCISSQGPNDYTTQRPNPRTQ